MIKKDKMVCQFLETSLKDRWPGSYNPFFLFLHPSAWKADVKAGARAIILDHEG